MGAGHALFELIHWAVCSFKSAYYGAVEEFSGKDVKFLIGDIDASQGAFQVGCLFPFLFQWLSILLFSLVLIDFF